MRTFSVFVALGVALLYCLCVLEVSGESCKQTVQDITKKLMQGIPKCTKSLKFKNGKEKSAKSACILKCVMQLEGVLNEEGKITRQVGEDYVASVFGEELREGVVNKLMPCLDEHGPGMDNSDEFCKSYDPFVKCLTGKLPILCAA